MINFLKNRPLSTLFYPPLGYEMVILEGRGTPRFGLLLHSSQNHVSDTAGQKVVKVYNTNITAIGAKGKKLSWPESKLCQYTCAFAQNATPPTSFTVIASDLVPGLLLAENLIPRTNFSQRSYFTRYTRLNLKVSTFVMLRSQL